MELDSLHLWRQSGSSAEEKRTGQQRLQALGDKLLSLRDVADGIPSFFIFFNLLSAKVVLNVPKPQTETTAFKHTDKSKLVISLFKPT